MEELEQGRILESVFYIEAFSAKGFECKLNESVEYVNSSMGEVVNIQYTADLDKCFYSALIHFRIGENMM